jgi:CTP synthase
MTRFIFITGGVVSSIGKGLTSASLGALLQARGYRVFLRKLDPYLNVDPGTMSPTQHGEVFVTDDGAETDLDLGHYERFSGINCTKRDNTTAGKIYSTLLAREREGRYLGATIQVIPHVTDLIKEFIFDKSKEADFVLCEIGGTVGDIEALPFLEAARQIWNELGTDRVKFVHVTLLPYITLAKELKTKPTQHSVRELRATGIQPDLILCRTSQKITDVEKSKIALFCNVAKENVISAFDVDNIYKIILNYHAQNLDSRLLKLCNLKDTKPLNLSKWTNIVAKMSAKKKLQVNIAIVGKYSSKDSYISLIEALKHASIDSKAKVNLKWINARTLKAGEVQKKLNEANAILIPGGFGQDGIEGKIAAIKYARTNNIPFFGICLGLQLAVIEFARNVCGLTGANSTEFASDTPAPVIGLLQEWMREDQSIEKRSKKNNLGGTMRLGAYECVLNDRSRTRQIYGKKSISERHRHRYEVNSNFRTTLEKGGLSFAGKSHDGKLMEIIELKSHPWYVGVQFHPEFKSRPFEPHPLFCAFIAAAETHKKAGDTK